MRQHRCIAVFVLTGLASACGGAAPDGTARPADIQAQLAREAIAATTCPEAQTVYDRFITASEETKKGTDRSAQNLALVESAYDRGTALGCPAFPKQP